MKNWMTTAVIAAALLATGCAHKLSNPPPSGAEWDYTYFAVVGPSPGTPVDAAKNLDRLKAYNLALQDIAGVTNLEDQYIGCFGCERLASPTAPPSQLKYIFYRVHLGNMHAFTRAMKHVQASPQADVNFVLTYNTDPPPEPACPSTCKPKYVCVKYGGCDGNGGTPVCDPCP